MQRLFHVAHMLDEHSLLPRSLCTKFVRVADNVETGSTGLAGHSRLGTTALQSTAH